MATSPKTKNGNRPAVDEALLDEALSLDAIAKRAETKRRGLAKLCEGLAESGKALGEVAKAYAARNQAFRAWLDSRETESTAKLERLQVQTARQAEALDRLERLHQ